MKQRVHMLGPHPAYWCPVCKAPHQVAVFRPFGNGAQWTWNGDVNAPTFVPSMHSQYDVVLNGERTGEKRTICHVTIDKGIISVLPDSKTLGGQVLPLEEWEPTASQLSYYGGTDE